MKSEGNENLEGRLNHAHCCDLEEMGTTRMKHQMLFFHGRGNRQLKTNVGVPLSGTVKEMKIDDDGDLFSRSRGKDWETKSDEERQTAMERRQRWRWRFG